MIIQSSGGFQDNIRQMGESWEDVETRFSEEGLSGAI